MCLLLLDSESELFNVGLDLSRLLLRLLLARGRFGFLTFELIFGAADGFFEGFVGKAKPRPWVLPVACLAEVKSFSMAASI